MQPGVITFRPDNFLTIGLMGAVAYVAAVLVAQFAMRAGLIGAASSGGGAMVSTGPVASA
jgi:hypothetical protein